ncbi:Ig-like domain-containing protein, partial [Winogradskyella vincentii]
MNTKCQLFKSRISTFKKSLKAFLNVFLIFHIKKIKIRPFIAPQFIGFLLILFSTVFISNILNAQNPGQASNFSIKGDTYSGAFNSVSDDWFQGPSGIGNIDESQTPLFLSITNSQSNQAFTARSPYNQYELVNGYLLYDAIYGRDYTTINGGSDFTTFSGSNKNGDNPQVTWQVGNSAPTGSVDLVDVYAHLRREGTTVNDKMWLIMAVSTMGNNGTHYVDFELYADPIDLNGSNGFQDSGENGKGGHTAWEFDGSGNLTASGDLDAGFAYSGSNITGIEVRIWVKRSDYENVTPATFTWGSEFDGPSNDSEYGYAQIVIPTGGTYDSGNAGNTPAPPWKTFKDNAPSFAYDNGAFAEVGIDLTALGIDPSLSSDNPCDAPFQKILIKTRASASFTSSLKDFAGPYQFLGSPILDPTIKVENPGHFLCSETQKTLSPLNPYPGAHYVYTTNDGEFLDGTQEYIGENAIITKPGKYKLTASPVAGCTEASSEVNVYAQPCAVDDDFGEIIENSPGYKVKVTLNDTDRDGDIDKSTLNNNNPLLQPSNGTLIIHPNNGDITYIPNPDYYGPDSFEYEICDDQGLCDIATVTVFVLQDTDNDGVGDKYDIDNDNDGIPDIIECAIAAKPRILNQDFEAIDIITSGLDDGPTDVVTSIEGIWKGDASHIPNWSSTDTSNHLEIWNNSHNYDSGNGHDNKGKAYSGKQWAEVNASSNNGFYQDINTTPGDVLQWSFAHRKREFYKGSVNEDIVSLEIGAPGSQVSQGNFASHPQSEWTKHTGTYTVPPGQTVTRLSFNWVQSAGGNAVMGNFVDNVELYFIESNCADTDGDGIPNYLDLDSDNDGIPDVVEAGFRDDNNDGLVDTNDYGVNGLADNVETFDDSGILIDQPLNTDASSDIGFEMYDFVDVDSDNDGITDTQEAFSDNINYNDVANDGIIDGFIDFDNNGWHDPIDAESSLPERLNSDADNIPNYLDLDSDGDGVPDTLEGNFDVPDTDNNGYVGNGIPSDIDFDGLADTNDPDFTGNILSGSGFYQDFDGDGLNNTIDIDADNDGIIDNTEASSTFAYYPPTGVDTDGDGIDNAYDVDNGGIGIGYINIDGGLYPDFLDVDAEDDGLKDIRENNIANSIDADVLDLDNDGMVDLNLFTDDDNDGLADIFDLEDDIDDVKNSTNFYQTPNTQPDDDPQNMGGDRDWREWYGDDSDLDNIPDYVDLDDDNDGILDTVEQLATNTDIDNDGIENLLDLDSDGDGIPDHTDAGGTFDADGSGMPGLGILDNTEVDPNGVPLVVGPTGITPADTDGDGLPNFIDLDADNDGIADVLEAGGNDANGDGLYGPGASNDFDSDGIADAVDLFDNTQGNLDVPLGGTPLYVNDNDGDGLANFIDLDSDNDTIPDIVEGQPTVAYNAPIPGFADVDGDGLNNIFDINNGGTPIVPVDTDGDYTPDYLDLDTDGDFIYDIVEAGPTHAAADTNNNGKTNNTVGINGLDDNFEASDNFIDPNGTLDDTQEDNFPDEDNDVLSGGDVDYRDAEFDDFDNDTVSNADDLDDDNDGILDTEESNGIDPSADSDSDGIANYLDPDFCTLNSFGICSNLDIDNDGIPNHFDLDSDGDGCNDALEGYNSESADPDFDGVYGTGTATVDANGLVIAAGVTGNSYDTLPADTDASSTDDFLESNIYVACQADLRITKTVDDTTPEINEIVTFTIIVTNDGPFNASGITVKDLLPAELTYNATGSTIPASSTYNSTTGIWDFSSITLVTGDSIELQIAATASSSCALTTNEVEIITSDRFDFDSTPNNNDPSEDDYATATLTVTDNTDPTWTSTLPVDATYQCNAVPIPVTLTATDNCGTATVNFNEVRTDGFCSSYYTLTRTWTATDCCGLNSIQHVQTITVVDTIAPEANPTNPILVQCFSEIPAQDPNEITGETDNCTSDVTVAFLSESDNGSPGTIASPYILTRIYRVSDDCGNYIDVPQTITVIDDTPPVIDTNAFDFEVQCDGSGNTDALNNWLSTNGSAAANDNCGALTWSNDYTGLTDSCGSNASATVTFTATDTAGNTATTTATFSIVDNISPEILGFPSGVNNEQSHCVNVPVLSFTSYNEEIGDGNNSTFLQGETFRFPNISSGVDALLTIVETVNATVPVLDDNTTGPNSLKPRTAFSLTTVGEKAYVEYKIDFVETGTNTPTTLPEFYANFNDIDGNSSYGEVNWTELATSYTVDDPTELTITEEGSWILATAGTNEYPGVTNTYPQVNISTKNTNASTYSFRLGAEARQPNVSASGRQHNIEFACIGNFTSASTFQEITLECKDLQPAAELTAIDDCSVTTVVLDEVRTDGSCENQYTLVRTWTATDACGNESKATQKINVIDTTTPVIDTVASDSTVECDGSGNITDLNAWLASNGGASASDICGDVTWTNDYTAISDECGATGSTTVIFTASDACGNTATTSATFTIEDSTGPSIDTVANDSTVECDSRGNITELNDWLASNGGASASDACGNVTWSNNFTALSDECGVTGSATVTFTATDDCGNTSITSATFTIEDTTAPTIDTIASDLTVECDGSGNSSDLNTWLASNAGASATDECSGVTWSNNFTSISDECGATGSAIVTFTATDECGNTATTSATFTIVDTTKPSIVGVPADTSAECDSIPLPANPISSDNCDNNVDLSFNESTIPGSCPGAYTLQRTWTATDDCGNTTSAVQTITVVDTTDPVLAGIPSDTTVECD